jgi:hypothetical protein
MGEAGFRREAAHALSTPLGGLLLQAELADHYLRNDKTALARDALTTLLRDFETFGSRFRSVFAAMADIAEEGGEAGDPRACLAEALVELGDESVQVGYRGLSPRVAMSPRALCALMRRLAMLATLSGVSEAEMVVTTSNNECLLSLFGVGADGSENTQPFESPRALHLCVAREIAARHGGRIASGSSTPEAIALVVLPTA